MGNKSLCSIFSPVRSVCDSPSNSKHWRRLFYTGDKIFLYNVHCTMYNAQCTLPFPWVGCSKACQLELFPCWIPNLCTLMDPRSRSHCLVRSKRQIDKDFDSSTLGGQEKKVREGPKQTDFSLHFDLIYKQRRIESHSTIMALDLWNQFVLSMHR